MLIGFTVELNIIKTFYLTEWFAPVNLTLFNFSPSPDVFRTKHKMFSDSHLKYSLTLFSLFIRILTWTKLPLFWVVSWNNDRVLPLGLFVSQCVVFIPPMHCYPPRPGRFVRLCHASGWWRGCWLVDRRMLYGWFIDEFFLFLSTRGAARGSL